jgi:hypothetical protein
VSDESDRRLRIARDNKTGRVPTMDGLPGVVESPDPIFRERREK